ncbi:MAG: patatin-like phospholipase family protein, partial [Pseudomonadota bacterium]
VLDRLLEETWLDIEGVSGTSAGAMNAVALVNGLASGGREGARALLAEFWEKVSAAAAFSPVQRTPMDRFFGGWRLDQSPMYNWMELWSQFFSPYEFNPFDINPLRKIVDETFDFDAVNGPDAPKLFQSATNVRTGRMTLFNQPDVSVLTTMASACLPSLYQAVEIGDEAYWDGGYMGNPPLFPLMGATKSKDLIVVQINPMMRDEIPRKTAEINNRLNEIIFNSSLVNELRTAGYIYNKMRLENVELQGFGQGRLHRIADEETMRTLSATSKMNASPDFMAFLFEKGRNSAEDWLETDAKELGKKTSWIPPMIQDQLTYDGAPTGKANA